MPTYQEWIADQNKQRAAAQGRLPNAQMMATNANQAMQAANNPGGVPGAFNPRAYEAAAAQQEAAGRTLGGVQGQIAGFDPMSMENQAAGNKYQAYDLARGGVARASAVDPTDQFIRNALQTAAGPEGGPFNAATRNAMFTNAMESSGADAQAQSIMESAAARGMSINDPSVQAALRRTQGEQAKAGQRARLGIDLAANPANYAAQQSAVNRLGDYTSGRRQEQQSAEDRLREMLWNEGFNKAGNAPAMSTVNFGGAPAATRGGAGSQPWQGFSAQGGSTAGWTPASRGGGAVGTAPGTGSINTVAPAKPYAPPPVNYGTVNGQPWQQPGTQPRRPTFGGGKNYPINPSSY